MELINSSPKAQIIVLRNVFSDISTIGELLIYKEHNWNNGHPMFTLEDTIRRVKKKGETAIPSGIYRLVLNVSPKFGYCPWILDVPFFSDIRIHKLNRADESMGCIGVGLIKGEDWIGQSTLAFRDLMNRLTEMNKKEQLWIEVIGGLNAAEMERE